MLNKDKHLTVVNRRRPTEALADSRNPDEDHKPGWGWTECSSWE